MVVQGFKIPNFKHQITNKFQYAITKTTSIGYIELLLELRVHAIVPLGTTAPESLVWNFEFGLFGICLSLPWCDLFGVCRYLFRIGEGGCKYLRR